MAFPRQIVTEFDPLAVQEPHAIEKQQDSPVQHGQVIPQIQEFLLRGGKGSFINDVMRLFAPLTLVLSKVGVSNSKL